MGAMGWVKKGVGGVAMGAMGWVKKGVGGVAIGAVNNNNNVGGFIGVGRRPPQCVWRVSVSTHHACGGGLGLLFFSFFFFSSLPFVRERLVGKGGRESWVEMGV